MRLRACTLIVMIVVAVSCCNDRPEPQGPHSVKCALRDFGVSGVPIVDECDGGPCAPPTICGDGLACCPNDGPGWRCVPISDQSTNCYPKYECDDASDCYVGQVCCAYTDKGSYPMVTGTACVNECKARCTDCAAAPI